MLLSLKKKKKKQEQKQANKEKKTTTDKKSATKPTKTPTIYNSLCLHHRLKCYQAIALNDQQVGSTSLALLSP